jgi:hypothetical protein
MAGSLAKQKDWQPHGGLPAFQVELIRYVLAYDVRSNPVHKIFVSYPNLTPLSRHTGNQYM